MIALLTNTTVQLCLGAYFESLVEGPDVMPFCLEVLQVGGVQVRIKGPYIGVDDLLGLEGFGLGKFTLMLTAFIQASAKSWPRRRLVAS